MTEAWKQVAGYEGRYLVSEKGVVYSVIRHKVLKAHKNEKGYLSVELWDNYRRKRVKIHRLVAEAFIPNPNDKKEINHIDGNKENNVVSNLEWSTRSENIKHAYALGLKKPPVFSTKIKKG